MRPHGLYRSWNSLGQNTGEVSLSLLQGIFPTQGSNPGFLHWRQILYQLSHKGSPIHSEESRIERDTCIPKFIAALFTRATPWKQPRCPSADERMRKSWLLFSVAQSFLFVTPWTATCQASLSFTVSWSLFKLMPIELVVMPTNYLILCHPPLLLPSIFPSIRVFSKWVSSSHQVAKVLELQFQHQSFQ